MTRMTRTRHARMPACNILENAAARLTRRINQGTVKRQTPSRGDYIVCTQAVQG
jgi:hypothetical protein